MICQGKAWLDGDRVPPNQDQSPKLLCRLFGHGWTKAPFVAGEPLQGARSPSMEAYWPYCHRCYQPKRPGLRGRSVDTLGWIGDGPRIDLSGQYAPACALGDSGPKGQAS